MDLFSLKFEVYNARDEKERVVGREKTEKDKQWNKRSQITVFSLWHVRVVFLFTTRYRIFSKTKERENVWMW